MFNPHTGNEAEDKMSQAVSCLVVAAIVIAAVVIGGIVMLIRWAL